VSSLGGRRRTEVGCVSSTWTSTQKIFKLEPTYVILSSSQTKKLAFFGPEFRLWTEPKVKICLQHILVISALGPEGHCTSCFKRVTCHSCRRHVDVYEGVEGGGLYHVNACGQEEESPKWDFLVDVING